jgi:hypothetical protein
MSKVRIIENILECEKIWKFFCPKISLFDLWEFRYCFYKAYQYKPYFIALEENGKIEAVLPLWYEDDKNRYTFFGGEWMEENRFLTKKFELVPELLKHCPKPAYLIGIRYPKNYPLPFELKDDEAKYILSLKGLRSAQDYLKHLEKSKRKDLKKDIKRIQQRNPKVIFNRFSDFETLVELSKKRITELGKVPDWNDIRRKKAFEYFVQEPTIKKKMLTFEIEGKIAGVELVGIFNKCYYCLKCGYDIQNFSGIGNYALFYEIDDAIKMGMKRMDILQMDYNWKSKYFQSIPLYKYVKS